MSNSSGFVLRVEKRKLCTLRLTYLQHLLASSLLAALHLGSQPPSALFVRPAENNPWAWATIQVLVVGVRCFRFSQSSFGEDEVD